MERADLKADGHGHTVGGQAANHAQEGAGGVGLLPEKAQDQGPEERSLESAKGEHIPDDDARGRDGDHHCDDAHHSGDGQGNAGDLLLVNGLFLDLFVVEIHILLLSMGVYSDLRVLGMEHGGDHLVEHLVVPDPLPVLPHYQPAAQADGHLAGVGHRGPAGNIAQEVAGKIIDVARQEGDGGVPADAPALGLVHGFRHGIETGGAQILPWHTKSILTIYSKLLESTVFS